MKEAAAIAATATPYSRHVRIHSDLLTWQPAVSQEAVSQQLAGSRQQDTMFAFWRLQITHSWHSKCQSIVCVCVLGAILNVHMFKAI